MIAGYLTRSFGNQAMALNRQQLDITDIKQFKKILASHKITAVINAAGSATGKNMLAINAHAPAAMAKLCGESNIPFIFLSSARVFDGEKKTPYMETDPPHPVDEYGQSKLTGETLITNTLQGAQYYIIRLPMVLGKREKNPNTQIISRLLQLAQKETAICVADDVFHSPLHAQDAAEMIKRHLLANIPAGLYHYTGRSIVSLADLVTFFFAGLKLNCSVKPVPHKYFETEGAFPRNLTLESEKIEPARNWKTATQILIQEHIAQL